MATKPRKDPGPDSTQVIKLEGSPLFVRGQAPVDDVSDPWTSPAQETQAYGKLRENLYGSNSTAVNQALRSRPAHRYRAARTGPYVLWGMLMFGSTGFGLSPLAFMVTERWLVRPDKPTLALTIILGFCAGGLIFFYFGWRARSKRHGAFAIVCNLTMIAAGLGLGWYYFRSWTSVSSSVVQQPLGLRWLAPFGVATLAWTVRRLMMRRRYVPPASGSVKRLAVLTPGPTAHARRRWSMRRIIWEASRFPRPRGWRQLRLLHRSLRRLREFARKLKNIA